jgi:hypothetical protein
MQVFKVVARLLAISFVVAAASVSVQAATKRTGQFFEPLAPGVVSTAKSTNVKGAQTQATRSGPWQVGNHALIAREE